MSEWVTFDSLKQPYRRKGRKGLPQAGVYWVAAQSRACPGEKAVMLAYLDFGWWICLQDLLDFGIRSLPGQGQEEGFDALEEMNPIAFRAVDPSSAPVFDGWNHG